MSIKQKLQDEILTLAEAYLLGRRSDIFWITKLEFFRRHELESSREDAPIPFYGRFLRHTYGPVCPEVYDSTRELLEAGLLEEDATGRARRITRPGEKVVRAVQASIEHSTVEAISRIADELKKLSFDQLKRRVYRVVVHRSGQEVRIADIPIGALIYGHPRHWAQVVPDDVLRSFQATLEACKPDRISEKVRGIDELERALA